MDPVLQNLIVQKGIRRPVLRCRCSTTKESANDLSSRSVFPLLEGKWRVKKKQLNIHVINFHNKCPTNKGLNFSVNIKHI